MFVQHATYEVIVDPEDKRIIYRVPQPQLARFLEVLVFNEIEDFRVVMEHPIRQAMSNTPASGRTQE